MSCPEDIPEKYREGAKTIAAALDSLEDVIISGHVNPDGDALGSVAAAAHLMAGRGKNFAIYLPERLPGNLEFLPLPGPVYRSLAEIPFTPGSAIYVDCSEKSRLPEELQNLPDLPAINIDHHICEKGLGSIANFIHTDAAATCQLMAYVILASGMEMTGPVAEAVALGLMTDTGNFSHDNTSANVFRLAALLEDRGCNFQELSEHLQHGMPLSQLKLWGHLMQRIHTRQNGRVACCKVWVEDLARAGCDQTELEGFVDWLRRIRNVDIGILIRQTGANASKFSLRSRGKTDVQKIATYFGGGGHRNAAGGTLDADPDRAETLLMIPVRKYLEHGEVE